MQIRCQVGSMPMAAIRSSTRWFGTRNTHGTSRAVSTAFKKLVEVEAVLVQITVSIDFLLQVLDNPKRIGELRFGKICVKCDILLGVLLQKCRRNKKGWSRRSELSEERGELCTTRQRDQLSE